MSSNKHMYTNDVIHSISVSSSLFQLKFGMFCMLYFLGYTIESSQDQPKCTHKEGMVSPLLLKIPWVYHKFVSSWLAHKYPRWHVSGDELLARFML